MRIGQRLLYLLLYWMPVPGLPLLLRSRLLPTVTDEFISQAGYVLVQAFGRNNFPDKTLRHDLDRLTGGDYFDFFHCLGRLWESGFDPGPANRALASEVKRILRVAPEIVVIAQWEVVYALWEMDEPLIEANLARIDTLWPPEEGYFATLHVQQASKRCLTERGLDLNNGIELAHPDMAIRAKLILWRLGLDPAVYLTPIPYVTGSVQLWVRGPIIWFMRESLGRVQHLLWRWISLKPPPHPPSN